MNSLPQVPPGFRFHPTDEELVDYYLRRKIASRRIDLDVIKDVDLYKIEPWDLQELCRIGREEQNEWYFFSHKDKKYPTGTRTNRATSAGFWKATGRDKPIYSKQTELIGMRKTLVFYKGRAPNGQKSDWIMHEYRLETDENATSQEEGWVVCRVFKKRIASMRKLNDYEDSAIWYEDHFPVMDYSCKKEMMDSQYSPFLQLPNLESPKMVPHSSACSPFPSYGPGLADFHQPLDQLIFNDIHDHTGQQSSRGDDQVTDWRVLDKFVASQLSHDETVGPENASASSLSCHVDLWK